MLQVIDVHYMNNKILSCRLLSGSQSHHEQRVLAGITPVMVEDAAGPKGTLTVMYSAPAENTNPLISSLSRNPAGHTREVFLY